MSKLQNKYTSYKRVEEFHKHPISYNEKRKLWITQVGKGREGRKQLTAKTKNALYDKLVDYYRLGSTLINAINEWISTRIGTGEITPKSGQCILYRIKRFGSEDFLNQDINQITTESLRDDISFKIDQLNSSGHTVHIRGVADYICTIRAIYRELKRKKYVSDNPAEYLDCMVFKRKCNCAHKTPDDEAMSLEDMNRLRADVYNNYSKYKNQTSLMVLLALDTGLRISEIPPLKKSDIVDGGTRLHVHSMQVRCNENNHIVYKTVEWTKNECGVSRGGRYVPLLPSAIQTLNLALQGNDTDLIFPNKNGTEIKTDTYDQYLRNHCKKLGIKNSNNHSIRKGFCSYVLSQQLHFPPEARASILGHSVEVDVKYYTFAGSTTQTVIDQVFNKIRSSTSQAPIVLNQKMVSTNVIAETTDK